MKKEIAELYNTHIYPPEEKWFGLSTKPKYNTDNDAKLAFMKSIEGKSLKEMKVAHEIRMKILRDLLHEKYSRKFGFVLLMLYELKELELEKYRKNT